MITHNFKISLRNLMRYKLQSFISILGLAVGFVCFAFSMWWIRYEMTYDLHLPEADRKVVYYERSVHSASGYNTFASLKLAKELKEAFAEIESFQLADVDLREQRIIADDRELPSARQLTADSTFIDWAQLKLLEGNLDFLKDKTKAAVSEEFAQRLFGTTHVVGRKLKFYQSEEYTVSAVFSDLEHSNFAFDLWNRATEFTRFSAQDAYISIGTLVLTLQPGVDSQALQAKMRSYTSGSKGLNFFLPDSGLCPLDEFHYSDMSRNCPVQFYYLVLFAAVGLLIMLAALFNYVSIFVVRLGIRRKEISLRKACGSSGRQLLQLFLTEYTLMLLVSMLVSALLMQWAQRPFMDMSKVEGSFLPVWWLYWLVVWLFTALLLSGVIHYYQHSGRTLREGLLRKWAVASQLTISIFMLFCMTVLIRQIHFLQTTDLGWKREGIAVIPWAPKTTADEMAHRISQFAEVDTLYQGVETFVHGGWTSYVYQSWEGKASDAKAPSIRVYGTVHELVQIHQPQLLEGRLPEKGEADAVVLNEAAVKALGMDHPLGKTIQMHSGNSLRIIGVMKNSYINPPTLPAIPMQFSESTDTYNLFNIVILYKKGKGEVLRQHYNQLMATEFSNSSFVELIDVEERYNEYLYAEQLLGKLLTVVSLVCVLISAFGVYSLITLSCERRRKEIAIRKVNGAKVNDILFIFIREYVRLLIVAAVIAFPIGYLLMKQWLVSYIRQVPISFDIYAGILCGMAALIACCIGWRVWRTSLINPAEVVKSE